MWPSRQTFPVLKQQNSLCRESLSEVDPQESEKMVVGKILKCNYNYLIGLHLAVGDLVTMNIIKVGHKVSIGQTAGLNRYGGAPFLPNVPYKL